MNHPDLERLWKHRRRMGWYGVIGAGVSALIGILIAVVVDPASMDAVRSISVMSIWAHLSLAAIYQGGASLVDAVARLRHGRI